MPLPSPGHPRLGATRPSLSLLRLPLLLGRRKRSLRNKWFPVTCPDRKGFSCSFTCCYLQENGISAAPGHRLAHLTLALTQASLRPQGTLLLIHPFLTPQGPLDWCVVHRWSLNAWGNKSFPRPSYHALTPSNTEPWLHPVSINASTGQGSPGVGVMAAQPAELLRPLLLRVQRCPG